MTAGLVYGGDTPGPTTTATVFYDGTSFSTKPALATARNYGSDLKEGSTSSAALFAGGYTGSASVNNSEEFTSSTNTITAAAFSSGASAGTARRQLGYSGAGTQDAFRVYGGFSPSGMIGNNEAYNGSSWSEGPDLNSARGQTSGGGTEPAAICFGGATPTIVGNTEEWNGSSWSEQNDLNTARMELGGAGTQTAGLACGGDTGPVPASALTEEYDGTSC